MGIGVLHKASYSFEHIELDVNYFYVAKTCGLFCVVVTWLLTDVFAKLWLLWA